MKVRTLVERVLFKEGFPLEKISKLVHTEFDKLPTAIQSYLIQSGSFEDMDEAAVKAKWNEFDEKVNETWLEDAFMDGFMDDELNNMEESIPTYSVVQKYLDEVENPSWEDFTSKYPDITKEEYDAGVKAYQEV